MTFDDLYKLKTHADDMAEAREHFLIFWPQMQSFIRDSYRNWRQMPWKFCEVICWKAFVCGRASKGRK